MSETIRTARNTAQSPTSLSIETLEEIVRNCQRNEDRLHELERHTRHERKKAERLLQETYRAIENRDSRNTSSIIEQNTTNDNSHVDDQQPKQHSSKEFFVPLDDDDDDDDHDENKKPRHRQTNNNNSNNNKTSQDKHLLERVEKLLAGDGTTTASSDVMSSQERQRKVVEKPTSPVEDDLDDRFLNINEETFLNARQLPSACSIDYELSTTDRLLSERTPINNQRIKTDNRPNETNIKPTEPQDEIKFAGDDRDRQFYERLNNYVKTGRFVSPDPDKQNPRPTTTTTTSDDETYQYKYPSKRNVTNKDEELTDLARRCEDLLGRLHTQRDRAKMLENSTHHYDYSNYRRESPPRSSSSYDTTRYHRSLSPSHSSLVVPPPPPTITLQQSLELLRPEFISRSRQRARRVRLLREEREHNNEMDRERREMLLFSCTNCCAPSANRTVSSTPSLTRSVSYIIPYDHSDSSSRIPLTYSQMKQATKKKYDQLPEVKNRRFQNQMDDVRRRNLLRAKVFRTRLRQHVARNGRTNIDESLTIIDT